MESIWNYIDTHYWVTIVICVLALIYIFWEEIVKFKKKKQEIK